MSHFKEGDEVIGWWNLALTADALEEVKGHKGIESIRLMDKVQFF